MASSLKCDFPASGFDEPLQNCITKCSFRGSPSIENFRLKFSRSKDFMGKSVAVPDQNGLVNWNVKGKVYNPLKPICVNKILKWWEKAREPNMIEIKSSQQFVDTLLNAGSKLVVVEFFSPGCGGCRALHPKICQIAGYNPDVLFLTVNMEELRTLCSTIRVHMAPIFRFYRAARGKLCSFSCNITSIKKLKDAIEKYSVVEYGFGPAKGLDENELLALESAREITKKKNDKDFALLGFDLYSAVGSRFQGLNLGSSMSQYEKIEISSKEDNAVVLA